MQPQGLDPARQMQQFVAQVQANLQFLNRQALDFRKRVMTLEVRQKLLDEGRTPRMPIAFQGQFGEDLFLHDLLGDKPDGLLIEVGAFDGKHLSVTYAMDALGWDCLLVEAIPAKAQACKSNRPHARVVHAALGAHGGPSDVEFTVTDDHWGGMLSFLSTTETHLKAVQAGNTKMSKVRVPRTTMDELLKDHAGEIAAAVIDVEGGEVELLKGFDLSKRGPRVLLIEDQGQKAGSPVDQYMQSQPYKMLGWLPQSRIYVRSDLKDLINRAHQMA